MSFQVPGSVRPSRASAAVGIILAALVQAPSVQAASQGPSFNCRKSTHDIEVLICKDQALIALDRKLAGTLKKAHGNLSAQQKKELDADQRGWVKGRNDCWKEKDKRACTQAEYTRRIVKLQARYGVAEVGTSVYYACGPQKTEVIFTPVATEPKTANLVRGEEVQTLILQPGGPPQKYEGDFAVTFVIDGGKATMAWPQDTSVPCLKQGGAGTADEAQQPGAGKPLLGAWGVETQHVTPAIKPGDDFYRYVNQGWLKTAKPPAGLPYANAFVDAFLRTQTQLRDLVDGILASNPQPGTDEYLIASLYKSYVDVPKLNELGLTPIKSDLDSILAISSHEDAGRFMGRPFVKSPINFGVSVDDMNPQRYVLKADQGGLGLPAPEYYLVPDEPYAGHRVAYRDYIKAVLERIGVEDAPGQADAIVALETAIAKTHWTAAERRDPVRSYRLMSREEVKAFAPGFPWDAALEESKLSGAKEIVLSTDTAIVKLAKLFADTPLPVVRNYMAFHYASTFAPHLSKDWQDLWFAFFGARLSGTPQQMPLENRALMFASSQAGEIIGRLYVQKYFPAAHREKMTRLVDNLRAAFRKRLEANTWMDAATRKEAITKLDAIVMHIGNPDKYRDYSGIRVAPDDLVGNRRAVAVFEQDDSVRALGETRRDWQWSYPAHEINAGYDPSRNSIIFPAGILQSPFFDLNADDAANYGAIGAVIGHEMGHGFDDQGSQADAVGKLRNWWTPQARTEFKKRADVLVEQFDGYVPMEGLHLNGALTLGENIGDLGGLTIAYDAYKLFVGNEQGGKAPVIDGYTGEQRFFLSWAQLWRSFTTPAQERENVLSDVHSPGEFRANGSVRNFDPWYAAFGVKEGDALYLAPDRRVRIW